MYSILFISIYATYKVKLSIEISLFSHQSAFYTRIHYGHNYSDSI